MSHPCEQNKCIFADPKSAAEVVADLKEIRKQVELYLGNGTPGILPKQMEKIGAKVDEHEKYINEQRGSSGTWQTIRLVLIPLVVAAITAAVTAWARAH